MCGFILLVLLLGFRTESFIDTSCVAEKDVVASMKVNDVPIGALDELIRNTKKPRFGWHGKVINLTFNDEPAVIKATKKSRFTGSSSLMPLVEREIAAYLHLDDVTGIPKYYGCINTEKHIVLILEDGGNDLLDETSPFRSSSLRKLKGLVHLARILEKIYNKEIAHYDFRPQNVLYHPETHKYSVVDLGSACRINSLTPYISRKWAAPEYNRRDELHECAVGNDLWHFFLLAFRLLTLKHNVNVLDKLPRRCLREHYTPKCVEILHEQLYIYGREVEPRLLDYIVLGLSYDRQKRPQSFSEVKKQFKIFYWEEEMEHVPEENWKRMREEGVELGSDENSRFLDVVGHKLRNGQVIPIVRRVGRSNHSANTSILTSSTAHFNPERPSPSPI